MKTALFLINLFCCFLNSLASGEVIIIMGASCSGKSTLSKKLSEELEGKWQLVELDQIEDDFKISGKDFSETDLARSYYSDKLFFYVGKTFYYFENFYEYDILIDSSSFVSKHPYHC